MIIPRFTFPDVSAVQSALQQNPKLFDGEPSFDIVVAGVQLSIFYPKELSVHLYMDTWAKKLRYYCSERVRVETIRSEVEKVLIDCSRLGSSTSELSPSHEPPISPQPITPPLVATSSINSGSNLMSLSQSSEKDNAPPETHETKSLQGNDNAGLEHENMEALEEEIEKLLIGHTNTGQPAPELSMPPQLVIPSLRAILNSNFRLNRTRGASATSLSPLLQSFEDNSAPPENHETKSLHGYDNAGYESDDEKR